MLRSVAATIAILWATTGCVRSGPVQPVESVERDPSDSRMPVPDDRGGTIVDSASIGRPGFAIVPSSQADRGADIVLDHGSWVGWGLADEANAGGFTGPYDLRAPGWRGAVGLGMELEAMTPVAVEAHREPGRLLQQLDYDGVRVEVSLYFGGPEHAVARYELVNEQTTGQTVSLAWHGAMLPGTEVRVGDGSVRLSAQGRHTPVELSFPPDCDLRQADDGYWARVPPIDLHPGGHTTVYVELWSDGATHGVSKPEAAPRPQTWRRRWQGLMSRAWNAGPRRLSDDDFRVAARAVETLVANWRSPSEKVKRAGLFPSWNYDGFHGFWAWDSWKHAVAVARFDAHLAKEQILVMLEAQDEHGMVPDVIYPGPEADNWRDTKPPLAAWAVEEVLRAEPEPDLEFAREVLPRLLRYHRWWFQHRDHDRNGLCEYGSTDGTRIAAAWESGMDNAVRFDDAQMLDNGEGAWSMDRESVDLNAYLVVEKRVLARLLAQLSRGEEAEAMARETRGMADRVRSYFWDEDSAWFRDRTLAGAFANGRGPEGWIPLWAGIATQAQAERIRDAMRDPARFGTTVPLGTLAADDPQFDPTRGYWRGPVWLDQAYFGLAGLRRYGFEADADALTKQLLDNAEGLRQGHAIRENYDPRTGRGQNARHFSWSAAAILMMLWELPAPA